MKKFTASTIPVSQQLYTTVPSAFEDKAALTTETKQCKTIPKQNQNNLKLFWVCFSASYM